MKMRGVVEESKDGWRECFTSLMRREGGDEGRWLILL